MIKKAAIGIVSALGALVGALVTAWVIHFGGPHGKLSACIERRPFLACLKNEMCANRDLPQLTCQPSN